MLKKNSGWNIFMYKLYKQCSGIGVIEKYLYKIKKIFILLYPTDEFSVSVKTIKLALRAIAISSLILLISVLSGKLHLYGYVIVIVMILVVNGEIVNNGFSKTELELLRQLENYLGEVRHYFHKNGNIEDAIYDSLENAQYEISLHINQIYEILTDNDGDKSYKYKEIAPNKYFMTFLALCELVMFYGDSVKDNQSLFLENINSLRDEIRTEILKREKVKYVFSGLTGICLVPPFTLKIIENWGISNLPELTEYYNGRYGLFVSVFVCLCSLGAYSVINRLKDNYRYRERDHGLLDAMCDISPVNNMVMNYMYRNAGAIKRLNDRLRRASENISVKKFILRRWCISTISFVIMIAIYIYSCMISGKMPCENITEIFLIIGCLFGAVIAGTIPDMMLSVRIFFLRFNMEDEVLAFHSIIIMLMHISRMDIITILEWMENFAHIFKASLSECVDSYTYDDETALEKLKNDEPYMPFVRIVENLQSSDNVGIEKAFEEIYSQRRYFMEKRKQDNEINIANKGAVGRVISFIPMIATIGLYLIIPFVMQSMSDLMGYAIQINGM